MTLSQFDKQLLHTNFLCNLKAQCPFYIGVATGQHKLNVVSCKKYTAIYTTLRYVMLLTTSKAVYLC